jgi:hypothetical protein
MRPQLLILKDGNSRRVVGARGFELSAQLFIHVRECSSVPRKQRLPCHFAPFPNPAEHPQTTPDLDALLHTHYTRKAFRWPESGFRDHQGIRAG